MTALRGYRLCRHQQITRIWVYCARCKHSIQQNEEATSMIELHLHGTTLRILHYWKSEQPRLRPRRYSPWGSAVPPGLRCYDGRKIDAATGVMQFARSPCESVRIEGHRGACCCCAPEHAGTVVPHHHHVLLRALRFLQRKGAC